MIRLFVGLGTPGPEYAATRHNAGFWWIDQLARQLGCTLGLERGFHGLVAQARVRGERIWLLQPQTFMNRSGRSVAALARFYKIPPEAILVAHDELDLAAGQVKLKRGGGHAGHNGLRDIHAQLGSSDYWRLRLGIGHPGQRDAVVGWVLKKPQTDDRIAIELAMDRATGAFDLLVAGDMSEATKRIHTSEQERPKPPRRPPQPAAAGNGPGPDPAG